MFSCLQILEAFLWFVLITLLNVTLIILTLSVSRLLNLLLRLVAFLLFLNPQCLASISRWITASSSWKRFCLFVCRALSSIMVICMTIPLQQLNGLETLVIIMVANKYAFLQITRRRFLNEWEAFKKVISRRNIRRRITIPLTLSNLKLLRRITRTENILHRNFTRRQVAIQNRVASNIGISQSTFSVKVLNLFSRSRRKTNKRKSKHSAMLRNKETRHRMFIGLLNTTRKLA